MRRFPGHSASIAEVRSFIRSLGARASLGQPVTEDLVLAVSEAAANAVRHGLSARITVRWRAFADRIEIEIADDGVFSSPTDGTEASEERGFGIPIMRAVMDAVDIRQGTAQAPGTTVRVVKKHRGEHAVGSGEVRAKQPWQL